MSAFTEGHLLGGRVRYAQPAQGFRSGIEPVLLAAAIPARAGERVIEGGTGAGAALLCLAARVPGVGGLGVEREEALAALAARNAAGNGFHGLGFMAAEIERLPDIGLFDHACANPPYHPPGGSASPHPARERAKRGEAGLLAAWAMALGARLRPRGSLTLILPAAEIETALAALRAGGCGAPAILPLWPRAGQAAKLMLVQGLRGAGGPARLLAGLALHAADGKFTDAAEAVLRGGGAIDM